MTKENCGCEPECGCNEADGKVHLHHLIHPIFNKMPEHLQDMLRGLDKQKIAVLAEVKAWADKNNQDELAEACEKKIAKINKRLKEEN